MLTRQELRALEECSRSGVLSKADHLLEGDAGGRESSIMVDLVPELTGDPEWAHGPRDRFKCRARRSMSSAECLRWWEVAWTSRGWSCGPLGNGLAEFESHGSRFRGREFAL